VDGLVPMGVATCFQQESHVICIDAEENGRTGSIQEL